MDFLKPRSHRMNRRRRIYEGKGKVLYEGPEPGTLIQHFKDDATAFNAKKHEVIEGKGFSTTGSPNIFSSASTKLASRPISYAESTCVSS
jgi:phosphoribosylaminoimidazole-succinocarboxamide synthase